MNDLFARRYLELQQWAERTRDAGWLGEEEVAALAEIERQQAEALFARHGERPLLVAFFGGTGVGKSSLLNRLAGEAVARVGVERPTSQEVTLYLHQDYQLDALPAELPLAETRIAHHDDSRRRLLAWLDMPDFDSVEERHRDLVQAWLPYIDWVVYVVSPERYQDDVGWRFVQQRGGRHAWLFVMNHWDRGDEAQIAHLRQRLHAEGFLEPVILRTSCRAAAVVDDQFPPLEQTLNRAIEAYGLKLLQQIGVQARLKELQSAGERLVGLIGGYPLEEFAHDWHEMRARGVETISDELNTASRLYARALAPQTPPPWRAGQTEPAATPDMQPERMLQAIWSERNDRRLRDLYSELESRLRRSGIPIRPFAPLDRWSGEDARRAFIDAASGDCARALLHPGSRLRRAALKISVRLGWLLPLSTAGWVAYHLVVGFYQGTQGAGQFLGIDYAIHSALLISLAWFLPWQLKKRLQPGVAEAVEGALAEGIAAGLALLIAEGEQRFAEIVAARDRCLTEYRPGGQAVDSAEPIDPRAMRLA